MFNLISLFVSGVSVRDTSVFCFRRPLIDPVVAFHGPFFARWLRMVSSLSWFVLFACIVSWFRHIGVFISDVLVCVRFVSSFLRRSRSPVAVSDAAALHRTGIQPLPLVYAQC